MSIVVRKNGCQIRKFRIAKAGNVIYINWFGTFIAIRF